jgi:pyruvate,orthophosphate dikinase
MLGGVGNDWQIQVNSAHLQNIRTWLELIECKPKWSSRLLSSLIIKLSLSGIFIKDTDLFPRDITRLLNSEIGPVFNLAKQLARLFPVYFNEIGAEGGLRDISTQIDEITHRKDPLVHFLRKQSHVEGSNQVLSLMENVLRFWATGEKTGLKPFVPPYIYNQIAEKGPYIEGVHRILSRLAAEGLRIPEDLLTVRSEERERRLAAIEDATPVDRQRIDLAVEFYRLLYQKYHVDFTELSHFIERLRGEAFPQLERLEAALAEPDLKKKLFMLLDYLGTLKDLIVSDKKYEVREDIYKKRHFTVDIPSMYGSYHEMKFDALGLTFRIESLVNVLFEELVDNIDLSLITKAAFYQIYARLRLFDMALKLDGLSSVEMELQLDLLAHSLEIKGFTITQYLDIFKGFARAVKNIINDYFNNVHQENLTRILQQVSVDQIAPKYLPRRTAGEDREKINHRVSEIFFRDQIALSLGLQQLDLLLSRILNTLYNQAARLPKDKLRKLLLYDPQNTIAPIEDTDNRVAGLIYLGNKGLNLMRLTKYGMRVPAGFIITTEVFRFRDIIDSYGPAEENYREHVGRHIRMLEKRSGKSFGSPENPLLLSIRSGSSISQPGMMDTFLDVGMNEDIAAGMAEKSGNAWFAWDNYRRFLQCYGMSYDMERDDFDAIIDEYKKRWGIPMKRDFSGDQMKTVALAYKKMIRDTGIEVVSDPEEQLFLIIKKVFESWDSKRARTYRKIMGISDDWGTAVTVQSMVYGNLSRQSGTGVFFTHNPRWSEDTIRLWGDFTVSNQGEDVVAGLVKTLPISISQQNIEMRDTDITMETHFPEIYRGLKTWANELIYERGWSPQEIEFTFESPAARDLSLLQSRDMSMRERKKVLSFYVTGENKLLGHGIGVSGGAMSGRVVFSLDEIDRLRATEPEQNLILARSDTVPDDIREIYAADGLLTARGGLTSHAAVVAHRLGKTCVVGCADMECDEKKKTIRFQQEVLGPEDFISIDGQEGAIYKGSVKIKEAG